MEIEKVEILAPNKKEKDSAMMRPQFYVKYVDGNKMYVPFEPLNRHYQEIQAWHKAQKKKPFKFDFKKGEMK